MKYLLLFSLAICIGCQDRGQLHTSDEIQRETYKFPQPHTYFPSEQAKVLVAGSFHFDYPGLDMHKTDESNKIDVLKEPKRSEVNELVEYIKKFRPTKIALEANPGWGATRKLREYLDGAHRDKRDERYQLGIRIAAETGLDTLYEVNSYSLLSELQKKDSLFVEEIVGDMDWDYQDEYYDDIMNWLKVEDSLIPKHHLLDYFKHMNSPESHQYGYGFYLTSFFKTAGHQGADHLSMWWYNRNLRIFRNIQDITESPSDRILVIMGNGHAAVLRQLFETSLEYEFVEFDSL